MLKNISSIKLIRIMNMLASPNNYAHGLEYVGAFSRIFIKDPYQ